MPNNHQKEKFNKYGQFMTEDKLVATVLRDINQLSPIRGNLLEPSFGKGAFINGIVYNYPFDKLDGYEIDPDMFIYLNVDDDRVKLMLNDFILSESMEMYDHIIGNPPYVEINYSYYKGKPMVDLQKKYKPISDGRLNLVHMFISKSYELLKENGYLSFLLPSIILTSPYYIKLRKFIYDNFIIEAVQNDVDFQGVGIKVSLIILKKTKECSNKFFVNYGENYYITETYLSYPKSDLSLKDVGFVVNVGNICWNHHKDELTDDSRHTPIIYTRNIVDNEIVFTGVVLDKKGEKKQYIRNSDIRFRNFIAFPRTISKNLKIILVKDNSKYHVENHLLVITHPDIKQLEALYNRFVSGEIKKYIALFNTSNMLSTREILSIPAISL